MGLCGLRARGQGGIRENRWGHDLSWDLTCACLADDRTAATCWLPLKGGFFDKTISVSSLIGQHLGILTTFSDMYSQSVKHQYGRWVRCRFEGRRAQGNHTCRWKTSPDGCSVSPEGDLRARGRVISIGKRSALARFRRYPRRCEKTPESAMITAQRSPLERKGANPLP